MNRIMLALLALSLSGCVKIFGTDSSATFAMHSDRRSSASVLLDNSLELDIHDRLKALNIGESQRIALKSFNRHVLITGQAASDEMIDRVSDIVAHTEGVRKVYNELTVNEPLTYWERAHDSWITARISSTMMMEPQMDPGKIHVVTENGTVYLIGIVTPNEEAFAVKTAKTTPGVKKVVKIFETKKA